MNIWRSGFLQERVLLIQVWLCSGTSSMLWLPAPALDEHERLPWHLEAGQVRVSCSWHRKTPSLLWRWFRTLTKSHFLIPSAASVAPTAMPALSFGRCQGTQAPCHAVIKAMLFTCRTQQSVRHGSANYTPRSPGPVSDPERQQSEIKLICDRATHFVDGSSHGEIKADETGMV